MSSFVVKELAPDLKTKDLPEDAKEIVASIVKDDNEELMACIISNSLGASINEKDSIEEEKTYTEENKKEENKGEEKEKKKDDKKEENKSIILSILDKIFFNHSMGHNLFPKLKVVLKIDL